MPVYYFIQPDLPDHIKELTLSYTFYRDQNANPLALSSPGGGNGNREE
jgi:cytochrome c oxidase assembly protein Cox11